MDLRLPHGWGSIAAINTAVIAAIAFVCAAYAGNFIHSQFLTMPPNILLCYIFH